MDWNDIERQQRELCARYQAEFTAARRGSKVGVSLNVREDVMPLNGMRHPPEGDTCGWYIYAGEELPDRPDFFVPLHVEHLVDWSPPALKYLGLPPGWRFLIAGDYEDVWYDADVLNV